jgi:hypothetical protein
VLAVQAIRTVSTTLGEIPGPTASDRAARTAAIRRWLRRYNATLAGEAAMIRVWADAALQTPRSGPTRPPRSTGAGVGWRTLRPRGFGDVDLEAVIIVALLGTFGARERSAAMIDAAAHIIERGFLGR